MRRVEGRDGRVGEVGGESVRGGNILKISFCRFGLTMFRAFKQ